MREMKEFMNTYFGFRYNLPYCSLIGGVLSMLTDQYVQINGFSNKFENWGGEDDDLFNRIKMEDLTILRYYYDVKFKTHIHIRVYLRIFQILPGNISI